MRTVVAIDFETADPKRDSACAIGLARVEGAEVVYRESALIRPPRGMSFACQRVHGLAWDDVKDAPPFAAVWAKMAPILSGARALVAHNAQFDRSVLLACCTASGIAPPPLDWVCTVELARRKWVGESNKLPDVCRRLGIPLTAHHDAGADAEAAARVFIALDGRSAARTDEPAEWRPSGVTGPILAQIPAQRRTPAVVRLMRDAESLGPTHARCLVRWVDDYFGEARQGVPQCRCGLPASTICSLCARCISSIA